MTASIYDFQVVTLRGKTTTLKDFEGHVLLIVNTASRCGFTPQYAGLESLYKKYKDRNFTVLAFPCNQFMGQEPGSPDEIQSFCELNFGVSFPIFQKIDVNGDHAHPLYVFLKRSLKGVFGGTIKWNFTKFLIDRTGRPIRRYAPATPPADIENDILAIL